MQTRPFTISRMEAGSKGSNLIHPGLKDLLEDDTYDTLCEHFLKSGKGRRVALPSIEVPTKRLLAQFWLLKNTACVNWDEVTTWFFKLFPDEKFQSALTRGQLEYRCLTAIQSLGSHLESTNLEALLESREIFNLAIPEPLARRGFTRDILLSNDVCTLNNDTTVTNNVVNSLETFRIKENLPSTFVYRWLIKLTSPEISESLMRKRVTSCLTKLKKLKKGKKEVLAEFLDGPFFSSPQTYSVSVGKAEKRISLSALENSLAKSESKLVVLKNENDEIRQLLTSFAQDNARQSEHVQSLKKDLSVCREEKEAQAATNDQLLTQVEEIRCSKLYKRNAELKKRNGDLEKNVEMLEKINTKLKEATDFENVNTLKRKLKLEQTAKSKLKKKCENLGEALRSEQQDEPEDCQCGNLELREREKNKFSSKVRLTMMALHGETDIAASKCSKVVDIVSRNLFGKALTGLPSASSVLNFSDESHHIAKQHVTESILNSEMFTFASDGTSRQKQHYIERHIVLDNGKSMSLGFTEIASDSAKSMLEQSVDMLEELSRVHCSKNTGNNQIEQIDQTLKDILRKMKALMSDRAANMKAFDRELAEYKNGILGEEVSTNFLFCNAHFLLGISMEVEKGLLEYEKTLVEKGPALGRDQDPCFSRFDSEAESSCSRLVRTAATVLGPGGDERSGCRQEWLVYCQSVGLQSRFSSFRGNRFNNLFENATAVLYHWFHIQDFLKGYCTHSNLKLRSIQQDIADTDSRLLSMVFALSTFDRLFTSPYWQLMNSNVPYGGFPSYVKTMYSQLQGWMSSTITFKELKPVFPDLKLDARKASLHQQLHQQCQEWQGPVSVNAFSVIVQKCKIVMKRQLSDFLPGGVFSNPDSELQKILDKCPLTNLTGERLFGDFDFDMKKRRRCSTFHRSTTSMWKHNNTAEWLGKKEKKTQADILLAAQREGKRMRKEYKESEISEKEKMKKKMEEAERQRSEKAQKKQNEKAAILDALISHGGVCRSKDQLDQLYQKAKLDDLKFQVKYRKVILGQKNLKVTGSKNELYELLSKCIQEEMSSTTTTSSTSSM